MRRVAALVAAVALLGALITPSFGERRIALVIGNSAYRHMPELRNPAHDAGDMAALLTRLGFEGVRGIDLDFLGMRDVIQTFSRNASGSDVALLFYAGHSLQVDGKNYLAPVDVQLETPADLDLEPQIKLPETGEPSSSLLRRLRELGQLKPWGAIVFDSAEALWGMACGHEARKEAVRTAPGRPAGPVRSDNRTAVGETGRPEGADDTGRP